MGKLSRALETYEKKYKEVYNPATAIGNAELISLQHTIDNIKVTLEKFDECPECDGQCDQKCDCCGHWGACRTCDGQGLIEK